MIMTEEFKKDINNSFKEIQENTGKQVEGLKKETQKSLKELQENNQTGKGTEQNHLGSKIGSRNNKENTKGDNSGDRNPRKEIRNHRQNTRIQDINRIQEMEKRISGAEDSIENMDKTIKENAKRKKDSNPKHPGNPGHSKKTKPKDNRYR